MRSRLTRIDRALASAAIAALCAAAGPGRASAQPAPAASPAPAPAKPTPEAQAKARGLVDEGIAAESAGDYDRAIARFDEAYALTKHPVLLFNMANSHRLAGRLDRAAALYEQYLSLDPSGPAAAEARELLARTRAELPPPPEPAPAPAPEPERVAIELAPDPPARPGRPYRIAGLALGGAAAVSAIAAIGFGLRLQSIESDLIADMQRGIPYDPERVDQGEAAERNQFIAAGLAGGFLIGGAALYWMGRNRDSAAQRTALVPLVGGGVTGLSWSGTLP